MTAAIYIRKSREDKEKPAHRLTVQREQLPAYAAAQGWKFEIYDDGHASAARGKTIDLQERARLEKDIRAGRINIILTIELSRLSRDDSMQDFVSWLHLCGEHRVKLATMSRMLDPSQHSDWMLLLMEGGFSSVEMKVLQARMKEGRAQAYIAGKFLGGKVPPPYVYDKNKGRPVIDPEQLARLQSIWENVGKESIRQTAKNLGLPLISIRRALADDRLLFYQALRHDPQTGEPIQCEWESCMSAEQAERIRAARTNRKRGYRRQLAGGLLSNLGIFICGYCGRSVRSWNNHRVRKNGTHQHYSYYGCKANETAKLCEKSRMVLHEIIDEAVITNFINTVTSIDDLRAFWDQTQKAGDTGTRLADLERQLAQLQAKKQRLIAAIAEGIIDFADAKTVRSQIEAKTEEIRQEQTAARSQATEPEWEHMLITREEFDALTPQEQRELLTLAVNQIRFYSSYLLIEYKFPRTLSGDATARVHLPPPRSNPTKNRSIIYKA